MQLLEFRYVFGNKDFMEVMYCNQFTLICSVTRCNSPALYSHEVSTPDPLWSVRSLLHHVQKNCAAIAVPVGCSSLDETTVCIKAHSRAKSYCPNKPEKYGVCFYAITGYKYIYLSSLHNNSSGNVSMLSPAKLSRLFLER